MRSMCVAPVVVTAVIVALVGAVVDVGSVMGSVGGMRCVAVVVPVSVSRRTHYRIPQKNELDEGTKNHSLFSVYTSIFYKH